MSNQATAQSPSFGATIDRPACPYCGERVYLTRRTPHPDYDLCYERQIFTCSGCDQTIERLVDANGNPLEHPHRVDCLDSLADAAPLPCRPAASSFLRGVTSNLRAASLHFEPECFCSCHSSRGSARHIMALVTTRLRYRYPPCLIFRHDNALVLSAVRHTSSIGIGLVSRVCVRIGYGHAQSGRVQTTRKRLSRSGCADNAARG